MGLKMKTIIALLIALFIVGCASPGMTYVAQNKTLAEQGKIRWSEYYEQAYAKYSESNDSGVLLGRINEMISHAKAYERGDITKDQFDYLRRSMESAQRVDNEALRHRQAQAMPKPNVSTDSGYQIVQPKPVIQTNCTTSGPYTNCTTR